jgi:hypothetical protein
MRASITGLKLVYSSHSQYSYILFQILAIMDSETSMLLLYCHELRSQKPKRLRNMEGV